MRSEWTGMSTGAHPTFPGKGLLATHSLRKDTATKARHQVVEPPDLLSVPAACIPAGTQAVAQGMADFFTNMALDLQGVWVCGEVVAGAAGRIAAAKSCDRKAGRGSCEQAGAE